MNIEGRNGEIFTAETNLEFPYGTEINKEINMLNFLKFPNIWTFPQKVYSAKILGSSPT